MSWFWTENQRIYFQRKKIDKLPRNWTAALIKQAFLVAWDLWKDRNDIKHSTPTAAARREMAKLDSEIDELQQVSLDGIPADDRKHPKLDADRQRQMTREQKRRWISTAEAIRVAHANIETINDPTNSAAADNRLITDWIHYE